MGIATRQEFVFFGISVYTCGNTLSTGIRGKLHYENTNIFSLPMLMWPLARFCLVNSQHGSLMFSGLTAQKPVPDTPSNGTVTLCHVLILHM